MEIRMLRLTVGVTWLNSVHNDDYIRDSLGVVDYAHKLEDNSMR